MVTCIYAGPIGEPDSAYNRSIEVCSVSLAVTAWNTMVVPTCRRRGAEVWLAPSLYLYGVELYGCALVQIQ
ncbi:hypothetical protein NDU88_005270 [Pleurodeles waltl]|uniref:Uncharacterized protein n=1 Tax=Pleurodeles waltl TaxID=8319 RepID=A0AAV7PI33_PLEWA|nr:hypothetical protein NDU88_005270 [Pleurodeles waltl]